MFESLDYRIAQSRYFNPNKYRMKANVVVVIYLLNSEANFVYKKETKKLSDDIKHKINLLMHNIFPPPYPLLH